MENVLIKNRSNFHQVINFNPVTDKLIEFDFTGSNKELTANEILDTQKFSLYINKQLESHQAKFGIGGYNENRVLYKRSSLFDQGSSGLMENEDAIRVSPRSVHLGIDIWGAVGTAVFVPVGGMVHSFAFNNNFGDYGATIILQHQLDTVVFHTLYGHVSLVDIAQLHPGQYISRGELIAHFGRQEENGWWPPHLHFQVIGDMNLKEGDYPGVCTVNESEKYLQNCPDPDLILNMMQYVLA
ncbi:MAG: peptidoglycan DD-metalloendopeptidase family protein [Ferruginibacter sp.]|nr:peptidoglycan DD-metalloendopeptidase family protein [Ferruginibacter sp.]